MYITKIAFEDLQDNGHKYNLGDTYPRDGYNPTPERIDELSTEKNKRGVPLIVRVKGDTAETDASNFYDNVEEYIEDTETQDASETEEYTGNVNEVKYDDPDTE